jgi:hypothetical protein
LRRRWNVSFLKASHVLPRIPQKRPRTPSRDYIDAASSFMNSCTRIVKMHRTHTQRQECVLARQYG